MDLGSIYLDLKSALKLRIQEKGITGQKIRIQCRALSAGEAIGRPEHEDYPIVKGKEVMVEAEFNGAKGQAFTDEFENNVVLVDELLNMDLKDNRERAAFVSGLNAVYRYLGLIDTSIHCRDYEPVRCAEKIMDIIPKGTKVLLAGYQPRFLEALAPRYQVRVIDLDPDNVNKTVFTTRIESAAMSEEAIQWCDLIFATGSSLVNGTIHTFMGAKKPAIFYGVTIAAAGKILNLDTYCCFGH